MELQLWNNQNQLISNISAPDKIFCRAYNEPLVHQVVVAYQANARSGNRKQKDRGEVNHSTKKPWRQKGTGRARAGMSSSPLWRGGGRIFPNTPDENFFQKINKKMYRAGICVILSQLVREDRLIIVEDFIVDTPKTKLLSQKLKDINLSSVLLVVDKLENNLLLASRNLQNFLVIKPHQVNPVSLVFYKKILIIKEALVKIERLLA